MRGSDHPRQRLGIILISRICDGRFAASMGEGGGGLAAVQGLDAESDCNPTKVAAGCTIFVREAGWGNDGKLDADPSGQPTEVYGFSTDGHTSGPAGFADAAFEVGDQTKAVSIQLGY